MPIKIRPLPPLTNKDIARFEKYVDKTPGHGPKGDCWPWIGYGVAKTKRGLLQVGGAPPNGRMLLASRIAYYLHYGEDPYPLLVCHACDWPPCVRGEHLFKGTGKDNMQDSVEKGRIQRGNKCHRAILTPETVIAIRSTTDRLPGYGGRLGPQFGIASKTFRDVINGVSWKHVP